jgi:hypothetical protein
MGDVGDGLLDAMWMARSTLCQFDRTAATADRGIGQYMYFKCNQNSPR